jgi:imidazolonepropionase-like amidohydrolase
VISLRLLPVLAVACGGAPATPPHPVTTDAIAIVDVTVVPMDREVELAHHTVIVKAGKIAAVGPAATTPVPPGARTIDGRGKWLVPGLADMHVHTFDPRQLALFPSLGVTSVRVLWGMPGVLGARDAIKAGEPRLAPWIYTAGPIDGKPAIWPGSVSVTSPAEATATVEAQARAGYDFVKVYSNLGVAEYDAIVAAAAKHRLPVIGHVPREAKLGHALESKQRSIEHLDGYAGFAERADSPVRDAKDFKLRIAAFRYTDDAKLAEAVARTKAAGTWNCPTLVVLDRISKLDHPDTARPEYKLVPPLQIASWDPKQDFRFKDATAEDFATMRESQAWRRALVKRLADAGAGILAGTDVGNPWLVPGYSLHQELELLVAAKLTPYQALRAATANAAEFLATTDLGTITVGARADLVLLDGDPLAQIENTQKIAGVMLRGRWLPAAELAAAREAIAADYRGERSRFTSEPTTPVPVFQARYRDSGGLSGEERVTAFERDGLVVVGETRLDGDSDARWELELGPAGTGRRMHVTQDGVDLVMVRAGDRATVTGRVGADQIKLDEPVAADEIFGGTPLGIDTAWQRTLAALAVDASVVVKLAVLELQPAVAIRHLPFTAKRLADATRTVAGKQLAVRVYKITVFGTSAELAIDAAGWPVETGVHTRL